MKVSSTLPKQNLKAWLEFASDKFKHCDFIHNPYLEAELLASFVLDCSRLDLQLKLDQLLIVNQSEKLDQFLNQRLKNFPLAYITGQKEFYNRDFQVNQNVLIPRPESEIMVEKALEICLMRNSTKPIHILDIGCGSGALGISLAAELTKRKRAYHLSLLDVSEAALDIAQTNAKTHQIQADFVKSDLLTNFNQKQPYDIVLANLPYVDRNWDFISGVDYEPELALYAEKSGLELIFKLINQLIKLNKFFAQSWIFLESDPLQQPEIKQFLQQKNFTNIHQIGYLSYGKTPENF